MWRVLDVILVAAKADEFVCGFLFSLGAAFMGFSRLGYVHVHDTSSSCRSILGHTV
jgi:hypothetical protein